MEDTTYPFTTLVQLKQSGEKGVVTGHCRYMRSNEMQYYVEYVAADGRQSEGWFHESQIAVSAV